MPGYCRFMVRVVRPHLAGVGAGGRWFMAFSGRVNAWTSWTITDKMAPNCDWPVWFSKERGEGGTCWVEKELCHRTCSV